uniref:Sorting nexin n=1 Tax=Globodera rostochiensis TaxID=31243 RepID=A0A914I8D2_GLORO
MAQKWGQVKAEFDFEAQPGTGELAIRTGEVLTILKEGIEGGWVEGRNSKGKVGLFPASYVKKIQADGNAGIYPQLPVQSNSVPPPMAPPPLPSLSSHPVPTAPMYSLPPTCAPQQHHTGPSSSMHSATKQSAVPSPSLPGFDAWDDPNAIGSTHGYNTAVKCAQQLDDDFDDDWSDEDEEVTAPNGRQPLKGVSEEGEETTASEFEVKMAVELKRQPSLEVQSDLEAAIEHISSSKTVPEKEFTSAHSFDTVQKETGAVIRSRSTGPEVTSISSHKQAGAGGAAKMKNINRFSNFVKSGMESYILATSKFSGRPGEMHEIVLVCSEMKWKCPSDYGYTCMVSKPKKESKLKGLKSFIAYSLTCSVTGIQVARRYKHFDWLHEQLASKYLPIPIPPLPEKQVAGLYEEDLIQHRRAILQLWVNKICRHPVLSQSGVWRHFMSCTDENQWKKGKRLAEKDEYVGGNFFNCIKAPEERLDLHNFEQQIDNFTRSSRSLEESCKTLYERIAEAQKRLIGPHKSNWQKLGQAFESVGQSLDLDQSQRNVHTPVKQNIKISAHNLHRIGSQHEEHGKKGLEQLLDFLYVSKGVYASIPDTVNIFKTVLTKMHENKRLQKEGKISDSDAEAIQSRVDVCAYAMLAEMTHQQEERDLDLAIAFGAFFSQQAAFYHNIGNQFSQLAELFKPK